MCRHDIRLSHRSKSIKFILQLDTNRPTQLRRVNMLAAFCEMMVKEKTFETLGPFIGGKIRRVLHRTRLK